MPESVRFEPNTPVRLKLADPEGEYDSDLRQGSFVTTDGRQFRLPRPAVVMLYDLEPRPGEEIQITRHLKSRPARFEWTICLTPASEKARAAEEQAIIDAQEPASLIPLLEASVEQAERRKPLGAPVLLKRGPRKAVQVEPTLFDRGTGTDGPLPQRAAVPAAAASPTRRPAVLPWNVAFREVTAWIAKELQANNLQWCDESQKSMACTVLIAEVQAGRIGPWERAE